MEPTEATGLNRLEKLLLLKIHSIFLALFISGKVEYYCGYNEQNSEHKRLL